MKATLAALALALTNPLLPSGPDPQIAHEGGWFYFMATRGDRLAIRRTRDLARLELALAFDTAGRLAELIVEGPLGVVCERQRRLAGDHRRRLQAHFLALEVALESIKK